ncbi:MAG: response regulator transcription factor [Devosia sp.]
MDHRILIVDDHPLFRAALGQTLVGLGALSVGEVADLADLRPRLAADPDWDLVLLDLNMPGSDGLSSLLLLRAEHPELPVMVVSGVTEPRVIRQALALGASGYLVKSAGPAEIRAAVATVLAGGIHAPADSGITDDPADSALMRRLASLTPQQVRVLLMLGDGLMNKQIAHQLSIAEATVKAHVSSILQKLDVDSRTQAVIAASRIRRDGLEGIPGQTG